MATRIAERSTYWVVTGGSNPSPYGDYRFFWIISYEQTDNDRANNRSKVIVDTYLQTHFTESHPDDWMASGYTYYGEGTSNVYIDGSLKHSTYVPSGTIQLGESWALSYKTTYSEYLKHNDDGTRSFTWKGTGFGKGTAVSTYTLPTIERQSILSSVSNFKVDDGVTVNTTKYVSSYYDKLQIYIGSTLIKTINNFTSQKVTFTSSELNTIYSTISSPKTSDTFTFKLSSYTNSNYSNQVGSTLSKTATGSLTIVAPTFGGFDYIDANNTTYDLTGDRSKIVKGYSTVKVSIPSNKSAVANTRGATISHYLVEGNTLSVADAASGYSLYNYSKDNVTVVAVDSRGTTSTPINVSFSTLGKYINYTPLTVKDDYDYVRSDNEIGEIVTIYFDGTWWNNNFGATGNWLNVSYKFKKSTSGSYINGSPISANTNGSNFSFNSIIYGDTSNKGFDIASSYDVVVTINDALSSKQITYDLHAGEPAIAIYGNKCSLGAAYNGQSYIKDNCTIDAATTINSRCDINGGCYINGENIQNFKGTKISSGTSLPGSVTNGSIFILY